MAGYRIVNISLRRPVSLPEISPTANWNWWPTWPTGTPSGSAQHPPANLVLADADGPALSLWQELQAAGLATPNLGYLTDIICCPGGDYCSLANAKSIPVAEAIQARFEDLDYLYDLGPIELNISGCMNACGHHHIGHIGILGVDKKGQGILPGQPGGSQAKDASIGKILGPSFSQSAMPDVIDRIIGTYLDLRQEEEVFLDTYRRVE